MCLGRSLSHMIEQGETRWSSNVQEALSMNLNLWRTNLPDTMKWKESDPPASDINAARMRAKYYGARYIIHRPLLYHALHYGNTGARIGSVGHNSVDSPSGSTSASQPQQTSPSIAHNSYGAPNMSRMMSDLGSAPSNPSPSSFPNGWTPPNVDIRDLPTKLRRACKICVDSAIMSTIAFDGIEDRLVVTNIFGTAHAYVNYRSLIMWQRQFANFASGNLGTCLFSLRLTCPVSLISWKERPWSACSSVPSSFC